MTNKLRAVVASLPDRERVVLEIYFENQQVAEISNEPGMGKRIEIFARSDGKAWCLNFTEFYKIIQNYTF